MDGGGCTIGDIAKSQPEVEEKPDRYEITVDTTEIQGNAIEALKQAVAGRLGKRLLVTHTLDAAVVFNVEYDPTEYPEQIRTRLVEPDATAGTRYCRTLLEVDAIQVRRDNLDDLLRFTGGGTMTIPRTQTGGRFIRSRTATAFSLTPRKRTTLSGSRTDDWQSFRKESLTGSLSRKA